MIHLQYYKPRRFLLSEGLLKIPIHKVLALASEDGKISAQQIQKLPQQKGQFHFHNSTSIEIKSATEQAARQNKCIQIPLYSIINKK